ncbi:MAG: DUF2330 domain-containing protein [Alphaproteobacteria bacterium]|nr:DUF2330 domain-containing protein [Alphaproteobacteria bacterium]
MLFPLMQAAHACGGLACATTPAQPLPVVQNAERIAFSLQPDGMVEVHVQVSYEGPPDAFAWLIPIAAADPEVFVSNDALFGLLDRAIAPLFTLNRKVEGNCGRARLGCMAEMQFGGVPVSSPLPDEQSPAVVTAEGQVGPYDYVVLEGNAAAVTGYLQANAFDVTDAIEPALQPYIFPGGRFLAVRLNKDADTGDIAPLGFRYPGDAASIPIQLTAIAAAEDMGVQVHVFGDARAVPENYNHVWIDEAKIDWANQGANYYDVVARAVDQAGGHAFVTEFSGLAGVFGGRLWSPDREGIVTQMATTTDLATWVRLYQQLDVLVSSNVVYAFDGYLAEGELVTAEALAGADVSALHAQVDARLFESLRVTEDLFAQPWVTRLSTTLDPAEMTLDPIFVINPDLPQVVSNQRQADLLVDCRGSRTSSNARFQLLLEDGRAYDAAKGTLDLSGVSTRDTHDALIIEQLAASGPPVVLVDHTEDVMDGADPSREGRGCTASPVMPGIALGLLGLLGLRRRPS